MLSAAVADAVAGADGHVSPGSPIAFSTDVAVAVAFGAHIDESTGVVGGNQYTDDISAGIPPKLLRAAAIIDGAEQHGCAAFLVASPFAQPLCSAGREQPLLASGR